MNPILMATANMVLKGPAGSGIMDLPVTKIVYGDGQIGLESCWQLDPEELEEVKRTGNIYFVAMGQTHPPVCLSPYSSLSGKVDGQYDTGINLLTLCKKNPGPECETCTVYACPSYNWYKGGKASETD